MVHSMKRINSFWVLNGNIYLKISDNVPVISTTHVSDLEKYFEVSQLVRDAEA